MFACKSTVPSPNDPVHDLVIKQFKQLTNWNCQIYQKYKKSQISYCGISGMFISLISQPISYSMSKLFNNLFEIGHFPEIWKIAHITAVYKRSGLKSSKSSYRPISILPTLSKIFESVIHERLLAHCTEIPLKLINKMPIWKVIPPLINYCILSIQ